MHRVGPILRDQAVVPRATDGLNEELSSSRGVSETLGLAMIQMQGDGYNHAK